MTVSVVMTEPVSQDDCHLADYMLLHCDLCSGLGRRLNVLMHSVSAAGDTPPSEKCPVPVLQPLFRFTKIV